MILGQIVCRMRPSPVPSFPSHSADDGREEKDCQYAPHEGPYALAEGQAHDATQHQVTCKLFDEGMCVVIKRHASSWCDPGKLRISEKSGVHTAP